MVTICIQIIITILMSLILYTAYYLGKNNPTMIVGFKWGVTAQEVAQDKRWLKTFYKFMKSDVFITLIGGIATSFLTDAFYYILALLVPTVLILVYLSVKMPRGGYRM